MQKNNYSTIIDFGSSELRLGVFNKNRSKLFFQSKKIFEKNNHIEYLEKINLLIKDAESKVSTHIENLTVLYDSLTFFTVNLSVKKKIDQIDFKDFCSLVILNKSINKRLLYK